MFRRSYTIPLKPNQKFILIPIGDIHFDCVHVSHRILKRDLTWIPAGELKAGDELIGFDEHPSATKNGARHLRPSRVISHTVDVRPCLEVELETGERIITTHDHPWLSRYHGLQWRTSAQLRPGQAVVRSFAPWKEDRTWEAGWLAGFFDGEGCLTFEKRKKILTLQAGQNAGPIYEQAFEFIQNKGFRPARYKQADKSKVWIVRVMGGTGEIVRFLGTIRPSRLVAKLPLESLRTRRGNTYVSVVNVRDVGMQPVAVMGTSTKTYFAEGYAMHNTDECDRERLGDLIKWIGEQEKAGAVVRLCGLGDMLDFLSPSNRSRLAAAELYETARGKIEKKMWADVREFVTFMSPLRDRFLGLLTGHHVYRWGVEKESKEWVGRTSDEWIARQLRADYWGDGIALVRLLLPHNQFLDVFAYHGSGGAQTLGGRVQKRVKFAEICPSAHIVITGHDNAKLGIAKSGLDYEKGSVKRYLIGSGSFQRAYLPGVEAGYAERGGLVPCELGVVPITISVVERRGKYRVDYHVSV